MCIDWLDFDFWIQGNGLMSPDGICAISACPSGGVIKGTSGPLVSALMEQMGFYLNFVYVTY